MAVEKKEWHVEITYKTPLPYFNMWQGKRRLLQDIKAVLDRPDSGEIVSIVIDQQARCKNGT